MNKHNPKIALAMIIKADNREAELLDRCLGGIKSAKQLKPEHSKINLKGIDGLAKYVDAIYLTITGDNEACENVAKKYGAIVSHYKWDYNFAAARNFNFSQVPKEFGYIVWTDADDVWRAPKYLRGTVQSMKKEAVDLVNLMYFYHFDEGGQCDTQHRKTRIIKNDGCVQWNNAELHEDFAPQRQIVGMDNRQMAVLHLTDTMRIVGAKVRNTEIAQMALSRNPNDPRNYWNLANAYLSEFKYSECIPVYLDFLGLSQSEEERFLAWHRLALAYKEVKDLSRAIACELEALGLRPWYPDAYFGLGELYLKTKRLKHSKEMLEMGFTKEVPENEMIVWNPRDYDYIPRIHLAEVNMMLFRPKETIKNLKLALRVYPDSKRVKGLIKKISPEVKKFNFAEGIYKKAQKIKDKKLLKKLLDSVPDEFKYYPAIVNLRNTHFVKKESTGRDLVIYCSYTTTEWDPEIARTKGVGGSEEAVIQLAKRWAKAGYNVSVYANIGHKEKTIDGVKWIPFAAWNYRDKQDITIIWRHPKALDYEINSRVVLVDMHDVIPPEEFTPERITKVTKVMFKSHAHRKYCSNIPDNKVEIIPHGLDISQFTERAKIIKKNPYKIVNTSSPDRGLLTNLEIVERVYNKLPDELKPKLKFRWNYGFKVWDGEFESDEAMMTWKDKALQQLTRLKKFGIVEEDSGDMISQDKIVDQYLEAGLLLYPSEFFEIGFISGTKAILAGAIPVVTDVFAQGEFLKEGIIVHSEKNFDNWLVEVKNGLDYGIKSEAQKEFVVDKIVEYMKNPEKYTEMRKRLTQYAKKTFNWDKTATAWSNVFKK